MLRSQILRILARRLSNRDVEDISEAAIDEMEYVQRTVLERLPNQPWFLERETIIPWPRTVKFVELPEGYNGLMTHGGVWFNEAVLQDSSALAGILSQPSQLEGALTPEAACVTVVADFETTATSFVGNVLNPSGGPPYSFNLATSLTTNVGYPDGQAPVCGE